MPTSDPTRFVRSKVGGIYYRERAGGRKTFYIRYTDPKTNKRVWSACESFEHAKSRLADVTVAKTKGSTLTSPTATLNDILPGWRALRETKAKPRSRETEERNLRLYILPRWGDTRLRDIDAVDVETWVRGLKRQDGKPMNDGTRALVLAHLSSLLTHAMKKKLIASNPIRMMDDRPKQTAKTKRNLRDGELAAVCSNVGRQTWLAPILQLLAMTGLRLGEVVGLQWDDIAFSENEGGTITVQRQIGKDGKVGTPKSGKPRAVPMMGSAREILEAQRKRVAKQRLALGMGAITPDTPVFTNSLGKSRQPRDVQRAFDWARDRAKLSEEPRALTLHDFRHSFATVLANEPGAVLSQIQAVLGHSSITITDGYVDKDKQNDPWRKSAGTALAAAFA
jgi:integrase